MKDNTITYLDVLLSLAFVAIAFGVSLAQKLRLERDIAEVIVRTFVQLVAIGYVLKFIFAQEQLWWTSVMIIAMTFVGAYTSAGRAKGIPKPFAITLSAMVTAIAVAILLLLGLSIIPPKPMFLIPIAGMVIGNTMNTLSVMLIRIREGFSENRDTIEVALALGKSPATASANIVKSAARLSLIPMLDRVKVSGIIFLPGAMTGMILAGASPLQAVKFQIIIMYLLIGTPTIATLIACRMAYRRFFNDAEQLTIS